MTLTQLETALKNANIVVSATQLALLKEELGKFDTVAEVVAVEKPSRIRKTITK